MTKRSLPDDCKSATENSQPAVRNSRLATLPQWLAHFERLHPQAIAMGLERVVKVRHALGLAPSFPVITVGGTNGKGSCCAMLETMLLSAGYRVGCYTSPHLVRYNERVRIDGVEIADAVLCGAFARIEEARDNTTLTYFEFGTLAAMRAFIDSQVDVAIMEVGLGGRLDAVNAFDADCALVASVALDHVDYLGDSRDAIGFEKAGIFRAGRPAICADRDPPETLLDHARAIGAQLIVIDRDFGYRATPTQWQYWGPGSKRHGLPVPALRGVHQFSNAAACIAALDTLRARLPVAAQDVRNGLVRVQVAGRFQTLPGLPTVILDVAHNPHAAEALAANLAANVRSANTIAVFSMLKDKDIAGVVNAVKGHVNRWHVASVGGPRAASAPQLACILAEQQVAGEVVQFDSIADAWHTACQIATRNDKILVFGSFLTVGAVIAERQNTSAGPTASR